MTGALKHLLFFMGAEFNQAQDISLNLSDCYFFLLRGRIGDRSQCRDNRNQDQQQQTDAQGSKKKKFHCFKRRYGSVNELGQRVLFALDRRYVFIMAAQTDHRPDNQI